MQDNEFSLFGKSVMGYPITVNKKIYATMEFPLLNCEMGNKLKRDKRGVWSLVSRDSTIRYLDEFESNFIESTIRYMVSIDGW